ncbi:hypothetical protein E4T52_11780 [Aureobasidium sp. EXF-3400]|nr:hypothetical protein E4T51_10825 [Aureobasidium sp. EXF-12344]KAI4773226.1 hypothetical protein E4T52_11780 [Aureobasidium sp. EXF-3400]
MAGSDGYRADSPISVTIETDDYYDYNDKDDPKRRISNITATSVSSFPDSAWPSDSDLPGPFYSSAKPRPAYRVGSLRRSPLPERLSPSSLRPPKHTSHRPRSRDECRRPRSRGEDVLHHETLPETPAPLVLLHITVLPPRLPWNRTVLDATLHPELKRQFGVLRAATSGLVAQRGILIAHPREEFELLEESVLEALDLLPERIGYDGQYRPRTPNTITDDETDGYNDEAETPICETCQRVHVGDAWYTRVYAANGLMRAGAWGACWSEMERVDVEVRPCISERICRKLDEMQLVEDTAKLRPAEIPKQEVQPHLVPPIQETTVVTTETHHALDAQLEPINSRPVSMLDNDLPPIYHPKDVPLRLLLRNYLYLVLRDRRNVAIFFLALSLLASTFYGMIASQESVISASKAIAVDESPIPPAVLPRIDVGHGKRHPMWKQDPFEPQEDGGSDEHSFSSQVFESDRHPEHMSRTVVPETTVQLNAAATTSVAAANIHISTETTVTFSSNPAFLPLLHGAPHSEIKGGKTPQ